MNPTFCQPTIDIIKTYAMHGLVHGKRSCQFCVTEMRLIKTDKDDLGYFWVCPNCFWGVSVCDSTPLQGIRLRVFDLVVKLFERGYHPIGGSKMIGDGGARTHYFLILRKAYGLYMRKMVLPYIKLPGPVEMDETLISRKRWSPFGKMPKLKWAFGLYCRQTKIPLIFFIKKKTHWCLTQLMKMFCDQGITVFTDCHSAYINWGSGRSHLGKYGWYHFWINHSEFYVHEKYPFVCTGRIENCWRMLKQSFSNIKVNTNPKRIDEILNTFCLRNIVKYHKTYAFTLKRIRDYWHYNVQKFLNRQSEGDLHPPALMKIDHINEIVKERGYLWLPSQDPNEVLCKIEGFYILSSSGEFLDTTRAKDEEDEETNLHPSIITLGKDPFKGVQVAEYSQSRIVCASLELADRGQEDKKLKEQAVKPVVKRKEAFNQHAQRVYQSYKNCEYQILDISSLGQERGTRQYYDDMKSTAKENTHSTGDLRTIF